MPMRKHPLALLTLLMLLAVAVPAHADPVSGVVQASGKHEVTVGGRTYAIQPSTELTDLGGERIDPAELKPGTPCEIELDEAGGLTILRAALVR